MFSLLLEGGIWMIPIGLCSITAVAFAVERFLYLYLNHTSYSEFWEEVEAPLGEGDVERAIERVEKFEGFLPDVVGAGLSSSSLNTDQVEEEMKRAGSDVLVALERFLPAIDFIAQVSPLLGLLGTVAGMIETFQVISKAGVGDPNLLAGGIYTALVTTAAGLSVGIVALFLHYLLRTKVDGIVNDLESSVRRTISLLEETNV